MPANQVFRVYNDEETMLKVYNRRLGIADRKFHQRENIKQHYLSRYENHAEEDQFTPRGHRVNVTSGISIIDTLYSSMTAVDIEFIVKAVGNGDALQSLAAERGLNQAFHDTKAQERAKSAVKDAQLVDIGWVKVYYDYVEDVETRDVPTAMVEAQIASILGEKPNTKLAELTDLLDVTEEVEVVLRDRVCIDYVPWDQIRVDASAKRIEDVRWVAQYTRLPVPEVTRHPTWRAFMEDRYGVKKTEQMLHDLRGDTSVLAQMKGNYDDVEDLGEDEESDDQRVTMVEMWDLETGLVSTFPRKSPEMVMYQFINPLMFNLDLEDRNPFKPLVVREDPEQLEGIGDMRVIWPSLEELDEYRSAVANATTRSAPKYMGPEDALSEPGKKALQSQEWGEYVGLKQGTSKQEVGVLEIPQLPEQAYQVMERIAFEMEEATGASEPMRGVFPSRRTTATESGIVSAAGEQRQSDRRGKLEHWYLAIARTTLQLMQVFYNRDRMLRYTDDLGEEFVWAWNKADIALDADLRISLTPKENLTRAERVNRALQWMNLVLALPEADRGEVMRFVGREMGFRDEEIRAMVKSDKEVQAEQQEQQIAAELSVKPQPFGTSPPGLTISQGGRG